MPTISVSGMKIVVMTVRVFIMLFIRFELREIYESLRSAVISRSASSMSVSLSR
ncbi:hypothetical protein D3C84_1221380 [compost metagenome]